MKSLRLWTCAALAMLSATAAAGNWSVEVRAPFVDLHSAPGERFPIVQVAEHGEQLDILVQRARWYKVRTADGHVGWVSEEQLITSLEDDAVMGSNPAAVPAHFS